MNYLILLLITIFMVGCTNLEDVSITDVETDSQVLETITTVVDKHGVKDAPTQPNNELFSGYKLIEVDGGDLSGYREPNVVVDIGYGDREYWAFTNEYGQLVRVIAKEINLQDDSKEPVLSNGRYYTDEAKVPGVKSKFLDEGPVIADSLGGVSNLIILPHKIVRSTDMVIKLIWKM